MATPSRIVIFLPGISGSSLTSWGELRGPAPVIVPLWPDKVMYDIEHGDTPAAETLLTDPGAISACAPPADDATVVPYQPCASSYATITSALQSTLGSGTPYVTWQLGLTKLSGRGDLVIGFGYDWRQSNGFAARCLQTLLFEIDSAWGRGTYRVALVAHSMGGLAARAYLENVGRTDPWLGAIAALVTLGTPHLGAPMALDAAQNNTGVPSFDPAFGDFLINDPDFPSNYELLPPPQVAFVTNTASGADESLYLPEVNAAAVLAGASAANLNESQAFFATLDYGDGPRPAPYYLIWGQCTEPNPMSPDGTTMCGFTWNGDSAQPVMAGTWAADGDGVVPGWSAQFQGFTPAGLYQAKYATAAAQKAGTISVNHFELVTSPDGLAQMAEWLQAAFAA